MEHAEALELIELAAVEPDGLERLMAGDTPESGAVAGHLAGCPACVAELARIRRTAVTARRVIATSPDAALRDRTLAFVREVGRERSAPAATVATPAASTVGAPAPAPAPASAGAPAPAARVVVPPTPPARLRSRRWVQFAGLAAALVLAAGVGFAAASQRGGEEALGYEVAVLQDTAEAALRLEAQPDARRVELAATPAGAGATGILLFSPSTGELVMVATGLAPLGAGEEYGCWVEVDGTRTRIGRMYEGGSLQAWAGPVEGLAALPADAVFGVSLVPAGGGPGEAVLIGS